MTCMDLNTIAATFGHHYSWQLWPHTIASWFDYDSDATYNNVHDAEKKTIIDFKEQHRD